MVGSFGIGPRGCIVRCMPCQNPDPNVEMGRTFLDERFAIGDKMNHDVQLRHNVYRHPDSKQAGCS